MVLLALEPSEGVDALPLGLTSVMLVWAAGHRQGGAGEGGEAGAVRVQDLLLRAGPQHHQGQERGEELGRRHGRPLPHLEGAPLTPPLSYVSNAVVQLRHCRFVGGVPAAQLRHFQEQGNIGG